MEVLEQFGFQPKWQAWVSILLATSSTYVLLNGSRGKWFKHFTGLRQGDPLSPMLFIIAMEPFQRLFYIATTEGLLSPLGASVTKLRASLYADDAAVFSESSQGGGAVGGRYCEHVWASFGTIHQYFQMCCISYKM